MFGAIGVVSNVSMMNQIDTGIGSQVTVETNSGMMLKETKIAGNLESKPIKDADDEDELTAFKVDPSSAS